jgi:hypothetical protein
METKIRELRLEVDKLINSVEKLNPSREVSLCYTNLQRAKSWLGMVLGELGTQTPYPKSNDPTSPVIEPQAEHKQETIWNDQNPLEPTQTAHVKYFRQQIDEYQKRFEEIGYIMIPKRFINFIWGEDYLAQSKFAMIEAKHWLGWELYRIIKEKEFDVTIKPRIAGDYPQPEYMPL